MSGTREGGLKGRETIYKKHGKDFFKKIGAKGGRAGNTGGFASLIIGKDGLTGPERAKIYGIIAGNQTTRGKAKKHE